MIVIQGSVVVFFRGDFVVSCTVAPKQKGIHFIIMAPKRRRASRRKAAPKRKSAKRKSKRRGGKKAAPKRR